MESVTDTKWDVLIAGTGLPQSLLALALSRSDKKVLHVDKNEFYGGSDAALTLQDAEAWVTQVNAGKASPYINASITEQEQQEGLKLAYSRSYSLALSPQIIYTRSVLLPTLVSSKTYRQLEFLAVGDWFVYTRPASGSDESLRKIPNSREHVFADKSLDVKSKRSLISFLRSIRDPEEQAKVLEEHGKQTLSEYLTARYKLTGSLESAINALTLSPEPASKTTVAFALPRIERHLASIGVFGAGFAAVIPKWGGLTELAQVACRAQAVGGGTYMLGKGIQGISTDADGEFATVSLDETTSVSARSVYGCVGDIPDEPRAVGDESCRTHSVAIVAAGLNQLFVGGIDNGPKPTVAIASFPAGTLQVDETMSEHPAYLMVHSSETGECPAGQCVVYASIKEHGDQGRSLLVQAVQKLLAACGEEPSKLLWSLDYDRTEGTQDSSISNHVGVFSDTKSDLAYNDEMLQEVRAAWGHITAEDNGFMEFEDREIGAYDDEDE